MSHRREFEIPFVGLKPGIHVFEYRITDSFFEPFGTQDFTNSDVEVKLSLTKESGFMQLHFDIGGSLNTGCDRCGNMLNQSLWDEFNILVKLVENADEMNNQEEDPDVYYLERGESHLQIANWIYEFINLSLPMQKMCSEEQLGGPLCNKEVLEKLKSMKPQETTETNSMLKALEKFNNLDKSLDN